MTDLFGEYAWVILLLAFLVVDLPLVFGLYLLIGRMRLRRAQNWGVTLGEIVESRLIVTVKRGTEYYSFRLAYEYEVSGQTYRGTRLNFGFDIVPNTRRSLEAHIAPYPLGRRLEVYYNPDDPTQAVLEKTAPLTKNAVRVLVISILGLMAALVVLAVTFVFIDQTG